MNKKVSEKERQKKQRNRKIEREKKKKMFMKLKEPAGMLNVNPQSSQHIFNIKRIARNGIWEIGDKLFSKTYLMEDINYCTMTYKEQLAFFYEWCRILNSLDVQLLKITVFNKNRDMVDLKNNILYQHKADEYNPQRDCYNEIIENKIINGKCGIEQVKYITVTISRSNYQDAKQGFSSVESNLIKEFGAFGSVLIPLDSNERLRILHDFMRMGDENKFDLDITDCIRECKDWRNEVCSEFVDFTSDSSSFRTERKVYKAMCIDPESYPEDELSDDLFDNLVNINQPSIFSIDIVPIAKAATKDVIEKKYMSVQDKIHKQQQKRNKNGDYLLDISYPVQKENEDIKEMLNDINSEGQKMFWTGVNMVIIGDDYDDLDKAVDSVNLIVENYGCYTKEFSYRQREALNTVLPIGCRNVDEMYSMFTRMTGILIPFKTMEMQMTDHPFYYGINMESKNAILCNRTKLVNGNGFVFGTTGAGKSFTGSKLEMGSVYLNTDDDIIVLDPTHEYEDVCNAFSGTFIKIDSESSNYINPLEIDVTKLNSRTIKSIVAQKSQIVCGICEHAMEKEFTSGHRSIVDRCIKHLFEAMLSVPVEQRTIPILSDFCKEVKNQLEQEAKDIALAMEVFTTGSLNIFNHQTNVHADNRLIVYGLRDIGEELESVGMLITLSNIRQRIIRNAAMGRVTWLYIDEIHELMDMPYSKRFIISLFKKIRKLGGICTGITQNVSDVAFDKATRKLIANSEYTMFLRMGAGDGQSIIDTFEGKISEAHIKYIESAAPGTGLIRFGNTVIPMDNRIEKGNIIYDIFNTNFYEKNAMRKAKNAM